MIYTHVVKEFRTPACGSDGGARRERPAARPDPVRRWLEAAGPSRRSDGSSASRCEAPDPPAGPAGRRRPPVGPRRRLGPGRRGDRWTPDARGNVVPISRRTEPRFPFTGRVVRRNSPNCCDVASISRTTASDVPRSIRRGIVTSATAVCGAVPGPPATGWVLTAGVRRPGSGSDNRRFHADPGGPHSALSGPAPLSPPAVMRVGGSFGTRKWLNGLRLTTGDAQAQNDSAPATSGPLTPYRTLAGQEHQSNDTLRPWRSRTSSP